MLAIVASICVVGVGRAQERGTITVTARVLSRDSTLRRLVRRAASRSAETGTVGATSARYAQIRVREVFEPRDGSGVVEHRRLIVYVEYLRN